MSGEHASERLIGRYAGGEAGIPGDEVWALEVHLDACAVCRGRLSAVVREQDAAVGSLVEGVWSELEPLLGAHAPVPRPRQRLGWLSTWASPVMVPWLVMTVVVTLLAVVCDRLTGLPDDGVSVVQLLAPVLPVLGVAASWARGLDPAYELTAAAPRAGLHLVLRRTASVLAVVIPALLVAGWSTGATAAQWLLPCLAFTTGTLALGGLVGVTRAAVALVGVWAAVIVAPALALSRTSFALQPGVLPGWAAGFLLGAVVVAVRKDAYARLGAHH